MDEPSMPATKRAFVAAGIGVAVAALLIVGITVLAPGANGPRAGADAAGLGRDKGPDVWAALARHEKTYLKSWRGAFTNPKPEAQDVLDAFVEVAQAVTGAGGFWRGTVPNGWFGCEQAPEAAVCQRLAKLAPDFASWEAFALEVSQVDPAQAEKFLDKNRQKLADYLAAYVPPERSLSGMKATPFYTEHLKDVVESGDRAAASASDDL